MKVWHDSVTLWRHAQRIFPDDPAINNDLGQALIDFKPGETPSAARLDEATTCFQRAIDNDSSFIDAYNNYGVALAMQGHVEDAMVQWSKVLAINPQDRQARANLERAIATLKAKSGNQ